MYLCSLQAAKVQKNKRNGKKRNRFLCLSLIFFNSAVEHCRREQQQCRCNEKKSESFHHLYLLFQPYRSFYFSTRKPPKRGCLSSGSTRNLFIIREIDLNVEKVLHKISVSAKKELFFLFCSRFFLNFARTKCNFRFFYKYYNNYEQDFM